MNVRGHFDWVDFGVAAWAREVPTWGDCVYRLYSANEDLFYIGRTGAPRSRLKRHHRTFGSQLAIASVEWVDDRRESIKMEYDAIRNERPRLNIPTEIGRLR